MNIETAEAAVLKTNGNVAAAARSLGVAKSTVQKALGRHPDVKAKAMRPKLKANASAKTQGRTLDEFRHTYDKDTIIPQRINEALKRLGGGWVFEVEFAKMAAVSLSDLGNYRDGFADHVVALRESRRAWAGTTATAKAMREML